MDSIKTSQELVLQEINSAPLVVKNKKDLYFKKGENPLASTDTLEYFYFVMSGKIKIYDIDFESSKEQTLYMLSYGDMFDVVSLLDGKPNQYISEVLEDTHLIQLPLRDVKEIILNDEKFRQYFYAYVASQLKSMEELAVSLSFYDVYQRVIQLFARFTETVNGKSKLKVINNLRHEDIASMVGSVRKVVSRSLQQLKKDGIIEISRKNIHIKNFQKLLDRLSI
jgi:CRP/FNR family cyclic AMP-dependent transcriptional regulator